MRKVGEFLRKAVFPVLLTGCVHAPLKVDEVKLHPVSVQGICRGVSKRLCAIALRDVRSTGAVCQELEARFINKRMKFHFNDHSCSIDFGNATGQDAVQIFFEIREIVEGGPVGICNIQSHEQPYLSVRCNFSSGGFCKSRTTTFNEGHTTIACENLTETSFTSLVE